MLKHFKTLGQLREFWVCFKESYATLYKHKTFSRSTLYLPNIREHLKEAEAISAAGKVRQKKKKSYNLLSITMFRHIR